MCIATPVISLQYVSVLNCFSIIRKAVQSWCKFVSQTGRLIHPRNPFWARVIFINLDFNVSVGHQAFFIWLIWSIMWGPMRLTFDLAGKEDN